MYYSITKCRFENEIMTEYAIRTTQFWGASHGKRVAGKSCKVLNYSPLGMYGGLWCLGLWGRADQAVQTSDWPHALIENPESRES